MVRALRDEIKSGKDVPLLVSNADEGMAEVFYGLGELLTNEGGVSMGILYLQMALYVKYDHVPALAALAAAYESAHRYDDAVAIYDRIENDPALHSEVVNPQGIRPQLARQGRCRRRPSSTSW